MLFIYNSYKTVDLLLFFLFVKVVTWLKSESLKRIYLLIFLTLKKLFSNSKGKYKLIEISFFSSIF